jgi:hypothetical protein
VKTERFGATGGVTIGIDLTGLGLASDVMFCALYLNLNFRHFDLWS